MTGDFNIALLAENMQQVEKLEELLENIGITKEYAFFSVRN